MAGRSVFAATLILALLGLSACNDPGRARIPSYRHLEQNAPSSSEFEPRNSLPP